MSQENTASADVSKTTNLNSLIMKKIGMTRIFNSEGNHVPVTVLSLEKAQVVQVKTEDKDGYSSVKFAYNAKKSKLVNSPKKGELKKANVEENYFRFAETKVNAEELSNYSVGASLGYSAFTPGTIIDVTGITKGKGFAGVVKKYGFAGGPKSHGSTFHRTTGSIGNRATPGKVWKGKKMPGHMGAEKQTVKNLEIVEINIEKGYLLVKGSVPGAKNSFVRVTKV